MKKRPILDPDDTEACYTQAMRALGHRWHSVEELRRKLRQKGFADGAIQATLQRLNEERWLDDERFANALLDSKVRKNLGQGRIRSHLLAAGVDSALATRVLREKTDEEAEEHRLRIQCRKKLRQLRRGKRLTAEGDEKDRKKLTAYLLQQGYEYERVSVAVREEMRVIELYPQD